MTFSDALYGKAPRYVSEERLTLMLGHEFQLLQERLAAQRGDRTSFFVFADTVATKRYKGTNEAHGWLGVRLQAEPGAAPSEVILHVRMWDKENVPQQEALGIAGTNLIYAAFYYRDYPRRFIESLVDNLGIQRLEVDMLEFSGPALATFDNRLMSLCLVQYGLTNAVMFAPRGEVLQPSEVLYRKAVLVERGNYRPVTQVNGDMLNCATAPFVQKKPVKGKEEVVLMEITMNNLLAAGAFEARDFLSRVDLLGKLGFTTMISNYPEYYRLTSYFRRYTKEMIGVVLGINNLVEIFDEKYYEHLEGGILESFGRMFRTAVKLYIYPIRPEAYDRYLLDGSLPRPARPSDTRLRRVCSSPSRIFASPINCGTCTNTCWKISIWTTSPALIATSWEFSRRRSSVSFKSGIPRGSKWSRARSSAPSRRAASSATRMPPLPRPGRNIFPTGPSILACLRSGLRPISRPTFHAFP
ncbi:MAG: TonB-dependent receptor [Opitutus sp.]|nr:TonB-dependent receptor [Opitutus sp.]